MEQQKNADINQKKRTGEKNRKQRLAAAVLALALLAAAGGAYIYHQNYAVASSIFLDVNPGIELKISRSERVLSCTALDEEAAAVLFRMDGGSGLKGIKLDAAVSAIIGALVQEGYLSSASSILISVEDSDSARAARLQQELIASVDGVLQSQASNAAVFSQTLTRETAPAPEYADSGISAGKSALVRRVMEQGGVGDSSEHFDALAALSVDELEDLLDAGSAQVPIGRDAARQAAEEYAGTLALDSVTADVDPELDEIPACYEVELKTAWGEFEYVVDAWSGQVLSGQKDLLHSAPGSTVPTLNDTQSPGNAGPTPDNAQTPDDGSQAIDPAQAPATPQAPASAADIGADAARQAALEHAGLGEADVTGMKVKQDWDDGRLEYDVEFKAGRMDYEYTIDGATGAVLEYEQDWD